GLYAAAVLPGRVMDWHSPFLIYLWRGLIRLGAGVALFTALQSAVYVFSFYWLLTQIRLNPAARLVIVVLLLLAPPTMPWIATVEKTAFMSVILCACFVCSLRVETGVGHRGRLFGAMLALSLI